MEKDLTPSLPDEERETAPALTETDAPLSMALEEEPELAEEEGMLAVPDTAAEPEHVLLLCGGGHLAQEVARQAHYVGFTVDVVDIREEYATIERFPQARMAICCETYEQLAEAYDIASRHYVVVLTHSYENDVIVLLQALESPARYIGVAASERKKESLFAQLRDEGTPDAELACIRCPVGLDIGATTPQEVGMAIAAELVAARAGCLPRPRPQRRQSS